MKIESVESVLAGRWHFVRITTNSGIVGVGILRRCGNGWMIDTFLLSCRVMGRTVENAFLAYNASRLREGAQLLVDRMLEPEVTVALSMTGALTPAGLRMSAVIPLMRAGFVDWIISTGANLYHDAHFGLGLHLHRARRSWTM